MSRYTADPGSTLKERKCGGERRTEGERQSGWGVIGFVWDIMSIYAETHVQDLLTFFWLANPGRCTSVEIAPGNSPERTIQLQPCLKLIRACESHA